MRRPQARGQPRFSSESDAKPRHNSFLPLPPNGASRSGIILHPNISHPSCFPLEQFGLGDSKYDGNIDLLRREVDAKAKYTKALEISGGEEKLRSFQDLSAWAIVRCMLRHLQSFYDCPSLSVPLLSGKELQRKHGLHEEQKGIIEAGERVARSVKATPG